MIHLECWAHTRELRADVLNRIVAVRRRIWKDFNIWHGGPEILAFRVKFPGSDRLTMHARKVSDGRIGLGGRRAHPLANDGEISKHSRL